MSGRCFVFGLRAGAWRWGLVVALVATGALALGGSFAPIQSGVLILLPALALAVAMLVRPYLGARAIARLRARSRRVRVTAASTAPRHTPTRVVRGGRLIALALAGRAPPPALAGCR
jgi:choline-glycine betaine transporter